MTALVRTWSLRGKVLEKQSLTVQGIWPRGLLYALDMENSTRACYDRRSSDLKRGVQAMRHTPVEG